MTKSLLATGVLRLVTTVSVELDAPVSQYLPDLPLDNPWLDHSKVTVRHLLDHTSGLDDARLWQIFSERPKADTPLAEAFPDPESLLRIRSRPGSRFSYSNMGYTILGMLIESVTGGRYEDFLDGHVLAPLGMLDSTFAFTTQEGGNADPGLAWGHVDDGSRYKARPVFLRPATQFTTTAGDLARFTSFLLGDGFVDGTAFIDKALMRSRGRPSGTEAANGGLDAGYALGLGRRDRHDVVGLCHGGNTIGFVAMLCIFPEEQKAFAYSVNTDSESANYGLIDKLFVEALSIGKAPTPQAAVAAFDSKAWHGWYVLSPNRFEMFEYLDMVFGAAQVSGDNRTLRLSPLSGNPRHLQSAGSGLFVANDRATISHVLLRGNGGEHLISDGLRTYERVPTSFLVAHRVSVLSGCVGLIWFFVMGLASLLRYRDGFIRRPEGPAFVALLFFMVPIPFFMTQSFMAIGDRTPASILLAAATLALPATMIYTIVRFVNTRRKTPVGWIHGVAAMLILQWCVVLAVASLVPLRLWA